MLDDRPPSAALIEDLYTALRRAEDELARLRPTPEPRDVTAKRMLGPIERLERSVVRACNAVDQAVAHARAARVRYDHPARVALADAEIAIHRARSSL